MPEMKRILLLIIALSLCGGCIKKDKERSFNLNETGSGDGSADTTNTILYQHRDLAK